MADWQIMVRESLGGSADPEVVTEIAAHLEDACEAALAEGASPAEAQAQALAQVGDWEDVRRGLRRARGGVEMIRKVWIPGLVTALAANAMQAQAQSVGGQQLWSRLRAALPAVRFYLNSEALADSSAFILPWLVMLPIAGALGAYLSKLAGGSPRQRLTAALFPAITITLLAMIGITANFFRFGFGPGTVLRALPVAAAWTVLPAIALALGAAPFLRRESGRPSDFTRQPSA